MLAGFLISISIVAVIVLHNLRRAKNIKQWELKPNCLMTRHPLVFITGRRSLFYFLSYWNQIPNFLSEHGFDVTILSLNWNNTNIRTKQLVQNFVGLERVHKKVHLFIDQTTLSELVLLIQNRDFESIASITLIGNGAKLPPYRLKIPIYELELIPHKFSAPIFWKIHSVLTFQFKMKSEIASLTQLGWNLKAENGYTILERVQDLAERDLIQGASHPNLKSQLR